MNLTFTSARLDPRGLPHPYDVLLGVEATVRLATDDGRLVYEEPLFPVVELALALQDWLDSGIAAGDDFSFDSVESDETGLLWCKTCDDGWRIGALGQEFPDMIVYGTNQVTAMFSAFIHAVEYWLSTSLGRTLGSART